MHSYTIEVKDKKRKFDDKSDYLTIYESSSPRKQDALEIYKFCKKEYNDANRYSITIYDHSKHKYIEFNELEGKLNMLALKVPQEGIDILTEWLLKALDYILKDKSAAEDNITDYNSYEKYYIDKNVGKDPKVRAIYDLVYTADDLYRKDTGNSLIIEFYSKYNLNDNHLESALKVIVEKTLRRKVYNMKSELTEEEEDLAFKNDVDNLIKLVKQYKDSDSIQAGIYFRIKEDSVHCSLTKDKATCIIEPVYGKPGVYSIGFIDGNKTMFKDQWRISLRDVKTTIDDWMAYWGVRDTGVVAFVDWHSLLNEID